jgi:hypothetical protein
MEDRMDYEHIRKLSAGEFRRLTGVKPEVFEEMAAVVREAINRRRLRGGTKGRVSAENQLLVMLEYWREYRTHFHIGQSRGLSETRVRAIISQCENALIKSGRFRLPGKKALRQSDTVFEVILIDATETPVERPKKSNGSATRARKIATR